MSRARITYRAHPDATPQTETSVLGAVYAFVLSAEQRGRLRDRSGPEDEKERSKNDSLAKTRIP
jgi:hypothetical protein